MFFVRAGAGIQELTSLNDIVTVKTGIWLTLGGLVLLLPILLKERLKKID